MFPSAAVKDRGSEPIFNLVVLSLGASLVSSVSASISLAVSLEIIACGFPRAIFNGQDYSISHHSNEERKSLVLFEHNFELTV